MVRAQVDYLVDRTQLQAGRPVQASVTNRPSSSLHDARIGSIRGVASLSALCGRQGGAPTRRTGWTMGSIPHGRDHGGGDHPVPFRTRQLSPPSPRVLRWSPWEGRESRPWGMLRVMRGSRSGPPGGARAQALSLFGGRKAFFHFRTRCRLASLAVIPLPPPLRWQACKFIATV